MASMDRKSPQMLAQMLLHLGRLAHGNVKVAGLTPAQWTVLRYFSSANRFSRTASAFASFHGTDTRYSLADHQVARRQGRSGADSLRTGWAQRSPRPYHEGLGGLIEDPFRTLIDAIDRLPRGLAGAFGSILGQLEFDVSRARSVATFGTCEQCRYLEHDFAAGEEPCSYYCRYSAEALAAEELDMLCVDFEPARTRRLGATRSERAVAISEQET